MRHVAVMTATGAIGLTAVFSVDLLSLFWVSQLGDQAFKAAVGYVGLATFFAMSITIGLTIAASATVSRALGAGDRPRGRRLAASALTITAIIATVVAALMFVLRDWGLTTLLHASGEPLEVASKFLAITLPANVPMALGMAMSGVLRAVGDARRAMYVTLSGAIVTALLDPVLIFGFGLGVYGAAWATVAARVSGSMSAGMARSGCTTSSRARTSTPRAATSGRSWRSAFLRSWPISPRLSARPIRSGLLRHRRGGDRRRRHHRPGDACRLRRHLRADRLDRPDHRPELWRKADGQGPARADQFLHPLDRLRAARLGPVGARRAHGSSRPSTPRATAPTM